MFKRIKDFTVEHKYKILAGISFSLAGYAFYQYAKDESRVKLSSFLQALEGNQIDEVVVRGNTVFFRSQISEWYHAGLGKYPVTWLFNLFKQFYLSIFRGCPQLAYSCEEQQDYVEKIVFLVASAGITFFTYRMLLQQNTIKSKFPKIVENSEKFDYFYGSEEVKNKFRQVLDHLGNMEKFSKLGARVRNGILLYGPPGTGKTVLAKTLANEAKLPFIETCASEFQELYIGVGPKKIRNIFQNARKCPKGCIIFIDELDAIGNRHVNSINSIASRQTAATINQLLIQLDGFEQNKKIVVIGATNRPQLIDNAILRSGRFDIKIQLSLPSQSDRKGILKMILVKKKVPHELSQNLLDQIAKDSINWSGADIETLVNQSIYKAVRKKLSVVKDDQMREAFVEVNLNYIQ